MSKCSLRSYNRKDISTGAFFNLYIRNNKLDFICEHKPFFGNLYDYNSLSNGFN